MRGSNFGDTLLGSSLDQTFEERGGNDSINGLGGFDTARYDFAGAGGSFVWSATGTITATLTALGDNPPEYIGFSMGTMSGSTCNIVLANDRAVVTSILTGTVSTLTGSLCMRVYDVGKLAGPVDYTFTVSHP